ncbi:tRNA (adenosine(37)-N6)-threonylcarbamoyltransferase complex dimerization subunit type 1 TsaB [Gallaecimonas sp. GXIMD1310]|uniref:tRNA (adenosine(37)-N6)-threonylcarbamoyltransferase complex dimerization subunit type 1 TsaB n=1 Tax=Gallaecimonas sp. GXIMD1310 TaxID=3131926 RepID=UPI0032474108
MTVLLALDTATEACSAALAVGEHVTSCYEVCPQQHTQKILPMVDSLLTEAALTLADVDAIVYGRGPGSFTGVRIGIGMAQGLAFAAGKPLLGVSTLAALAQQAYEEEGEQQVLAMIDARMGELYCGAYQLQDGLMTLVGEEQVLAPPQLTSPWPALAVGTGVDAYPDCLAGAALHAGRTRLPQARYMLAKARQLLAQGHCQDALSAEPVYLRDKVTWKKLPGR